MQDGTRLAAVDLGSNSFRLEIGQLDHGLIRRTDYLKETVWQGGELDADRKLTPQAMQRGWDCLARFAERLAGFKKQQVRAVRPAQRAGRAPWRAPCRAHRAATGLRGPSFRAHV